MKSCSFIIPVYNCKNDLEQCVLSIKDIGLSDYEILLVDDGSTDGSARICDELSENYSEIKCIHKSNGGVSSARNKGLEVAKGDLIIFLDADDSIEPQRMLKQIQYMDSTDNVDLLMFGMSFDYYYNGKMYRCDELGYKKDVLMERADWVKVITDLFADNMLSSVWNKIYTKSIIEQSHLSFREDMFLYEDLEFSIRYMACCNCIYNSSDIVYHYRQSEDEGNAGRRLVRIPHLPILLNQIEDAFRTLYMNEKKEVQLDTELILLQLYLILAKEKIAVSSVDEIRIICKDFQSWKGDTCIIYEKNSVIDWLLHDKVYHFVVKKMYTKLRHKVAVKVKNTKLYQRMRK